MRVDISTRLDCSAETAWRELQKSSLWLHVSRPLVRILPATGASLPERWNEGAVIRCNLYLLGFIPIGWHTIFCERIDHDRHEVQSREHDRLIRRWDHRISIEPLGGGQSTYRDEIEIEAGPLTAAVWAFANWFYRHRQSRWRALAKTL